jgi:hypothetical protein
MRYVTLARGTSMINRPYIMPFHLHMFHGDEELKREWRVWQLIPREPLRLYKNVVNLAHIIQPTLTLVVSETVLKSAPKLSTLPRMQVFFERLYRLPWRVGDLSYRKFIDDRDLMNAMEFYRSRPHDPAVMIEPYYELLPFVVLSHQKPSEEQDARVELLYDQDYYKEFWISRRRLTADGVIRADKIYIFKRDIFAEIEPFIDWTFFLRGEVELDGQREAE